MTFIALGSYYGNSQRCNNLGGEWTQCKLLVQLDFNIGVLTFQMIWILPLQILFGNAGRREYFLVKECVWIIVYILILWFKTSIGIFFCWLTLVFYRSTDMEKNPCVVSDTCWTWTRVGHGCICVCLVFFIFILI